mgnify:CR=1 FL=1
MKGEEKVKKRSFSFINFLLSPPYIVEEEFANDASCGNT